MPDKGIQTTDSPIAPQFGYPIHNTPIFNGNDREHQPGAKISKGFYTKLYARGLRNSKKECRPPEKTKKHRLSPVLL